MAKQPERLGKGGIDLAEDWSDKFGAIAHRLTIRAAEPVDSPKEDLQGVVVDILGDSLGVFKVALNQDPVFVETYHFPGHVESIFVREISRVHLKLQGFNN